MDAQPPEVHGVKMETFRAIVRPFIALVGFIIMTGLAIYAAVWPASVPPWVVDLADEWVSLVLFAIGFYLGTRK